MPGGPPIGADYIEAPSMFQAYLFINQTAKKIASLSINPMITGRGRFQLHRGTAAVKQPGGGLPMISYLFSGDCEPTLFQVADTAWLPAWSTLSWSVFVPAAFVGNVVLAIFAWFVVEWAMKLI
jgi:hypothetical protein